MLPEKWKPASLANFKDGVAVVGSAKGGGRRPTKRKPSASNPTAATVPFHRQMARHMLNCRSGLRPLTRSSRA
jgi:hypothetical protein